MEKTLKHSIEELFQAAREKTYNRPVLQHLYNELVLCHQQWQEPMRVALVGKVNTGKSTLINALLEEIVVATGVVETTFKVNRLRIGPERSALLLFKEDGRAPRSLSFDQLLSITKRSEENIRYLEDVESIEVFSPSSILKDFDLIDTPGLESLFQTDSQDTRDFLGLHGKELGSVTRAEAARADAIVYIFTQGVAEADEAILTEFQRDGLTQLKPFNTVGVLSKVDTYDCNDPLQEGRTIARRLSEDTQVRKRFYALHAVSGLLGIGAKTLTQDEFDILTRLARIDSESFERLIQDARQFNEKQAREIPATPQERQKVLERLGQYGIRLAYMLLRQGVRERRSLANALFDASGVPQLRNLILSHFGQRASIVKLYNILGRIETALVQGRQSAKGEDRKIVEEIATNITRFKRQETGFQEVQVLSSYYEGRLNFSQDDIRQLLEVTGENGMTYGARLGLGEGTPTSKMIVVAEQRAGYWRGRENDIASGRALNEAAAVLARSYERILYELEVQSPSAEE